jgi:hypothetical protein
MVADNFNSFVYACGAHCCSHNIMQNELTNTIDPSILELLISSETESINDGIL